MGDYLTLIYTYGFLISVFLLLIIFTSARSEVIDALKRFWAKLLFKRRFSRIIFIYPDKSTKKLYIKIDASHHEQDNKPFFINPSKSIIENGIPTFYYVMDNTFAHDFFNDPKEILGKILKEKRSGESDEKNKKRNIPDLSNSFHDILSEPYRFDARVVQEAMVKAQLGNQLGILEKILSIITSKNLVTIAGVIAIGAGLAAALSWLTLDAINQAEVCKQVAGVVANG